MPNEQQRFEYWQLASIVQIKSSYLKLHYLSANKFALNSVFGADLL